MPSDDWKVPSSSKKVKPGRACDSCRVRKVKCDGHIGKAETCTPCAEANLPCAYEKLAPKRGHSKRFVLEKRAAKMEEYLRSVMSQSQFEQEFGEETTGFAPLKPKLEQSILDHPPALRALISTVHEHSDTPVEDLNDSFALLGTCSGTRAGFGKSSRTVLAQEAWCIRQRTDASGSPPPDPGTPEEGYPWEKQCPQHSPNGQPIYSFPPQDLLYTLVDIYFRENALIPLLHRPTFVAQLQQGLHLRDGVFGANVLMICAMASRFCDDPRVLLSEYGSPMTSGWKWFRQVDISRSVIRRPTLFDVQFYALALGFMGTTSNIQACWILSGIGIRLAQEAGADRRTGRPPTVTDELWKRAWWALVISDRLTAENLGRAPAVNDEDMNQVLPIDCDDEYWETPDPSLSFKQPPGKPSKTAAFIQLIGLIRLLGLALRTIYCINRQRLHRSIDSVPDWEKQVVMELDAALKSWLAKLPPHLQIAHHDRVSDLFFWQSAGLHCFYYSIYISVHRPFIGLSGEKSLLSSSSLDLCVNAARSCSRLLPQLLKRIPGTHIWADGPAFTCGVILLLSKWLGKQSGELEDTHTAKRDLQYCLDFLRECSGRSQTTTYYSRQLEQLAASTPQELQKQAATDPHLSSLFAFGMDVHGQATQIPPKDMHYHPQVYPTGPFDMNQIISPPQTHFPININYGVQNVQVQAPNTYQDSNWGSYMTLLNGTYFETYS